MKPIIVAGNGPSVANIDYRRLPESFDTFRVNQFYFEDKYYLGKEVTKYLCGEAVLAHQYLSMYHIIEKNEYNFIDIHCYYDEKVMGSITQDWIDNFPHIDFLTSFYIGHKEIDMLMAIYHVHYKKYPTTGVLSILQSIKHGYTDIYVAGIDFYSTMGSYLYKKEGENFTKIYRGAMVPHTVVENGFNASWHVKELDKELIRLCTQIEGVNIYSISEESGINDLISLAPIQNNNPYVPESKPKGYVNDWFESPLTEKIIRERQETQEREQNQGKIQKIKQMFVKRNMSVEWEQLRSNIFLKIFKDTIQPLFILLKFIFKR